ncbi:ABC a-pheromone efflux pump AtrD [Aspergillus steynii IBT 23096]|uniref:ABC a-pheromone efflux pump AtrD n=1 Tax=Aspergillus steynii IBT 23096 TaxID=1392250 RepID=A0A2I2GP46_9EURO|nr:ABC a-pheromone efflux pump AtrD [Aspergillus steynii IBT 23096]PLB54646.1 ABC a-pheromone efflux pump AtrD [Aspergillus steynii IBT 23096]
MNLVHSLHRKPRWAALFDFTIKKHIPLLCLAILVTIAAGLVIPVFAIFLGQIFDAFTLFGGDQISSQDLIHKTTHGCIELVILGILGWLCNGVYFTLFVSMGEFQVAEARRKLFEGLLRRDQEWFESHEVGAKTFLSTLQTQLHELQMATSQPLGLVLQYSVQALASLGLAFYTSWSLSLVTLAGIPIFSGIISLLSSRMEPQIKQQQEELSRASKVVTNSTNSIDAVKCLNGQNFELQNFVKKVEQAASHYLKQARLNALQIATIRLMTFGMFVQGFWYGGNLAISGKLSSGEVLRTFWACLSASQSMELALPQVIVLEKGIVAAISLKKIIGVADKNKMEQMKGTSYPRYCEGDIEVMNLGFAYSSQPDRPILDAVDLFFPAGDTTFVIGESGSGKSTLGQLLARLYLPTSGDIRIDGVPIQNLDINWIRNNITLVEQRSVLFNESIFMNIAFGRRDYNEIKKEDIQDSINMAMLQSVIETLPHGIDTLAGPGGSFLSGGQRQRVAIARSRLRDTPILILDEFTSALDHRNRVEVMKALRKWRKGKTTIIITHDLTQILDHDFVYVMDKGSVAQAGYRYQLSRTPGNEKLFPVGEKDRDSADTLVPEKGRGSAVPTAEAPGLYSRISPFPRSHADTGIDRRAHPRASMSLALSSPWDLPYSVRWSVDAKGTTGPVDIPMHVLDDMPSDGTSRAKHFRASVSDSHPQRSSEPITQEQSAETSHPKQYNTTSLARIMLTIVPSLTRGQRNLLIIGCLCTLGHATMTPLFSYFLSQLLQTFYDVNSSSMKWALAVLGVAVGDGIISFFMHYFLEICGQAWVDSLRKKGFQRVLDQPKQWFDEEGHSSSQLAAHLTLDGEEMRNIVGRFGCFVLVAAAVSIMAVVWSLIVCWKLTLVALACGPVIYAITKGFDGTSGLWERRCNEAKNVASELLIEMFSEIRTVRTLTLESFFHRKHLNATAKCVAVGLRKAVYTGVLFGLVEVTIIFVSALIFFYGAILVSYEGFTVDRILTVFSMLLFSIGYAATVLSWIPQISTSRTMGSRLLHLANLPQGKSHEYNGDIRLTRTIPVKIHHLNFHYPSRPDALVLKQVSIAIPGCSCTAIVGRSGSGKSTIASLLLSLYEAPVSSDDKPSISFGGVDIRRLHTPTLRSLVSIVSQQPTLFPGTIEANISYGLEEDSSLNNLRNVRAAAKAAGIDDFVLSLPNDYMTIIGDGGVGLSGGQAQRVVIARALIRRPQVLILDEATSSLDPASAALIRQTVQRLVAAQSGLTVIIITHAREMMEIADNVVVLEQGRVMETGSYQGLLARPGGSLKALVEGDQSPSDK